MEHDRQDYPSDQHPDPVPRNESRKFSKHALRRSFSLNARSSNRIPAGLQWDSTNCIAHLAQPRRLTIRNHTKESRTSFGLIVCSRGPFLAGVSHVDRLLFA